MTTTYLQRLIETLPEDALPTAWGGFDLAHFSLGKQLYDYQQKALVNALRALWVYFHPFRPQRSSRPLRSDELKGAFWSWYQDYQPELDLSLSIRRATRNQRALAALLEDFYPLEDGGQRLDFIYLVNRMGFWMATGSGKTLVLVKLVELLYVLMKRGQIPRRDILILTHRDDLLEQIRDHVAGYNAAWGGSSERPYLKLHSLKDFAGIKRGGSLFSSQEQPVFLYRSDNLSDVQKERIVDFRNYDNNGEWYILLDEAHKGDTEESKRQHIFSILSRNGFLFNFSATFTDRIDIATTVANYNLSEFIRNGHGKHISVLRQEVRQFRRDEDYSDTEKQKIVLKALILLSHARHYEKQVRAVHPGLYHRPLLMTLVNSVNTEDADLKLFFRELVRIAAGKVNSGVWETARCELLDELSSEARFMFEDNIQTPKVSKTLVLEPHQIYEYIFNAAGPGEIEVLVRPSNQQEVAFKVKTADDPFALVRIGDITNWLKNELIGYEINERFADEGYFERLNSPESSINILLGSRSFYEGWDSNRPNVIMYINIGTGTDARKFILQSVGRGVRIEPLLNLRKRLRDLVAGGQVDESRLSREQFDQIKTLVEPLEAVYILGTSHSALETVIEELDQESKSSGEGEIALHLNQAAVEGKPLLIPVYRLSEQPLYKQRQQAKLALTAEDLGLLQRYMAYVQDDRVLMALHDTAPEQVRALRRAALSPADHFRTDGRAYRHLDVMTRQALNYYRIFGKEFQGFKPLEDEIRHFRHIRVLLEDISDLERRIQRSLKAPGALAEAKKKYAAGQMTLDELLNIAKAAPEQETFTPPGKAALHIRNIANHYYLPLLMTDDERIDYIRSIIRHLSEARFLNDLEDYLRTEANRFKTLDWWLFSRIEEHQDEIGIPYYYPPENKILNFRPDFIFWLKKGRQYRILFVDPKGVSRTAFEHKMDGYRALFESEGQPKTFHLDGLDVMVMVTLYTPDVHQIAEGYRRYWADSVERMLQKTIL